MGQPAQFITDPGTRAVKFINNLTHTKGKFAGQKFDLRTWQESITTKVYGTIRPDGRRQYSYVYIEIPRKNGKSELAAAFALKGLMADDEAGAEVYSAAADREQASLVFNVAAQMCRNDPVLMQHVRIIDSQKRIVYPKNGSFYRALSAEAYSKHGFNASTIIYDELHAAQSRDLYDVLTTSMGAREQPLVIMITTAGYDKNSICWEMHEHAIKVRDGIIKDDSFLPIIFAADEKDDWKDPKVWYKANPALGDFRSLDEMQKKFTQALEIPAQQNIFKRLYLNIWTEQETRWLPADKWDLCGEIEFDLADLEGQPCFVGVDLSTKIDLSAISAVFPPKEKDGIWHILCQFFMPEENLQKKEKRDKVPYSEWKEKGYLITTPGNVIDYQYIEKWLQEEWGGKYSILEIGYDPWNAAQFAQGLEELGFVCKEMRQGTMTMNAPSKEFEALIVSKRLAHGNNPVLNWQSSNVNVRSDSNGNYMPKKPESGSIFRIDGIVATIIGLGVALGKDTEQPYQNGLVVL